MISYGVKWNIIHFGQGKFAILLLSTFPSQEILKTARAFTFTERIISESFLIFLIYNTVIQFRIYFNRFFIHSSAWISKENLKSYFEYKHIFELKNKTKSFQKAIKEIEEAIQHEKMSNKITLQSIATPEIISTFDEHFHMIAGP